MTLKTIGHLCYIKICASFNSHRWIQSWVTVQFGAKSAILVPYELEIWRMTSYNNRAPLLFHCKLSTSFRSMCEFKLELQFANPNIDAKICLTFVTLTFDLWPRSFAWTSPLSMVIAPQNFMIRLQEHYVKGITDRQTVGWTGGQTDGRTDRQTCSWSCLGSAKNILVREKQFTGPIRTFWWGAVYGIGGIYADGLTQT